MAEEMNFIAREEFILLEDLPDPVGEESAGVSLYIIEDKSDNTTNDKFKFYPSTRVKGTVVCRADQSADTLIKSLNTVKCKRDLWTLA